MSKQAIPEPSVDYDGGSDEDQKAVLAVHHAWLKANDVLDYSELVKIWHPGEKHKSFNFNGYSYSNLADWKNIWDYYRPRMKVQKPYSPGNVHIVIRGDMAVIVADNVGRFKEWLKPSEDSTTHNPPYYRATEVVIREDGKWQIVHAHFSIQGEGERPDYSEKAATEGD